MSASAVYLSRRSVLRSGLAAGAALLIGFDVFPRKAKADEKKAAVNPVKAWMRMEADGKVTLIYSKSEMGQGISSALPMILADELELEWKDIQVEHAPSSADYGDQGTGGSGSITGMWMPVRQAGAAAREMLISAAAKKWSVDPGSCNARSGAVWHGNQKFGYAELVEAAAQLPVPDLTKVKLKNPEDFRIIGTVVQRKDIPSKTDGSAQFGLDVRVPGMAYAMVARCPVFGGKVKSFDASQTKALKGVQDVFEIDAVSEGVHSCGGVVVVADSTYIAMKGRKLLHMEWDLGPAAGESSETLRKQMRRLVDSSMKVIVNQGEAESVISRAPVAKKVECDYELPFQAHATMEPMNCTVHIEKDRAEAWAPTQSPEQTAQMIAQVSGLSPDKIKVHTTLMGGAFGRRYQGDFALEAAQVAKHTGKPVQLIWSREDDMTHDFYRPASYHRLSGAVDENGKIAGWRHKSTSTSINEWFDPKASPDASELGCTLQMPYLATNYKLEYLPAASAVPRAWWRSVEASVIGFVMESYVDELAHAAGKDPYEFRMANLGPDRMVKHATDAEERPLDIARFRNVLETVAKNGDWGKAMPAGQGRGIAVHYSFHSYVANLVEVEVQNKALQVKRVVSAVDIGTPVSPDGIRAQVESAIVYGLTAALKSQITILNGRAEQSNFDKFATLSMKETPIIEVHIVPSNVAPTGIGEPGLPPTAPALANAIFMATGKRIRKLPILAADLA